MKIQLRVSRWGIVAAVVAAGLLAGCFGGDDDNNSTPAVTSQVPASASASSAGFIAYLEALVVSDADMLEPVDTSSVTPPTDDTSEPVAIN
jgi:hypothetical protein